VITFI